MTDFSTTVRLYDLNDFIKPSQLCTKPLPSATTSDQATEKNRVSIHSSITAHLPQARATRDDTAGTNQSIASDSKNVDTRTSVRITLADCLACSGCVTTSEEILIEQQKFTHVHEEVKAILEQLRSIHHDREQGIDVSKDQVAPPRKVLVTISPQSIASLCAHYQDKSPDITYSKLRYFFRCVVGVHYVTTTTWAQAVSARVVAWEATNRWWDSKRCTNLNSTPSKSIQHGPDQDTVYATSNDKEAAVPLLVSSCPGFVCYMEKTHPTLLPHLSRVKSPQAVAPSILGLVLAGQEGHMSVQTSPFFHVSIQPCFDRKLEASRPILDQDTHCVVSTAEMIEWISDHHKIKWSELPSTKDEENVMSSPDWENVNVTTSSLTLDEQDICLEYGPIFSQLVCIEDCLMSSGGYHHVVLRELCRVEMLLTRTAVDAVQNREHRYALSDACNFLTLEDNMPPLDDSMVLYDSKRNSNHVDVSFTVNFWQRMQLSPNKLIRSSILWGFQHIQNITRTLRKRANKAHQLAPFIEVMACPGGCVNGSAQIHQVVRALVSGPVGVEDSDTDRIQKRRQMEQVVHQRYQEFLKMERERGCTVLGEIFWGSGMEVATDASSRAGQAMRVCQLEALWYTHTRDVRTQEQFMRSIFCLPLLEQSHLSSSPALPSW